MIEIAPSMHRVLAAVAAIAVVALAPQISPAAA